MNTSGTFKLSRRAILRASGLGGAAVALPLLDAMLTDRGELQGVARAQARPVPRRLVSVYWHYGAKMDQWVPSTTGAEYRLSPALEPLADLKSDLNVITGIANWAAKKSEGSDSHGKGRMAFATGSIWIPDKAAGGPSVEQFAAKRLGMATRLPSLVVSPHQAYPGTVGMFSWSETNVPVPPTYLPQDLFDQIFGGQGGASADLESARQRQQSILDFVKADATRLRGRLGQSDRLRLDAHLDCVRQAEQRLVAVSATACDVPTRPLDNSYQEGWQYQGAPDDRVELLMDLTAMALKCDLTRFVSFCLGVDVTGFIKSTYGDPRAHHDLSHDTSDAAKPMILGYTQYQMKWLAKLLGKLKAATEGDHDVLYNSVVYASSDVSDPAPHFYQNMPVLLAGSGGGRIATGRHINLMPTLDPTNFDYALPWRSVNDLFITMLNTIGLEDVTSFGIDGTRAIDLAVA